MAFSRPLECPACGHERIIRRPGRKVNHPSAARSGGSEWSCQLCAYEWSHPIAPRRERFAGAD